MREGGERGVREPLSTVASNEYSACLGLSAPALLHMFIGHCMCTVRVGLSAVALLHMFITCCDRCQHRGRVGPAHKSNARPVRT